MSARLFSRTALGAFIGLVIAGCSNKQNGPSAGEFVFDSGTAPDVVGRDTQTSGSDTGTVVTDGSSSGDSGGADLGTKDGGPPAVCPSDFTSPATVAVGYPNSASGELLAAITWDELTMVWTTEDGSGVTIHYGDRASPDAAFSSEHTLPSSLGPFASDKVALSADGLTMFFVSADHTTIRQISRAARGVDLDPSTLTVTPFRRLVGPAGEGGAARKVADLVLSKDGKLLFYTDLDRTVGSTINVSLRLGDGSWDAPNLIVADRLKAESGYRRRPTGLSSDGRTLFYFDEVTNTSAVAFRTTGSVLFSDFYAYSPNGQRAMPADSCARVYLTIELDGDEDAGVDGVAPVLHRIVHAP